MGLGRGVGSRTMSGLGVWVETLRVGKDGARVGS